jgi:hypothetical protein
MPLPIVGFTGAISGTTLTIDTVYYNKLKVGSYIWSLSASVAPGTYITSGSGTSWTVSISQNISSTVFFESISMSQINTEYGYGYDLNSYKGQTWFTTNLNGTVNGVYFNNYSSPYNAAWDKFIQTGTFATTNLKMTDFHNTRKNNYDGFTISYPSTVYNGTTTTGWGIINGNSNETMKIWGQYATGYSNSTGGSATTNFPATSPYSFQLNSSGAITFGSVDWNPDPPSGTAIINVYIQRQDGTTFALPVSVTAGF